MGLPRGRAWLWLWGLLALGSGCRSLDLKSGQVPCSKGLKCPSPFVCQTQTHLCVLLDASADLGKEGGVDVAVEVAAPLPDSGVEVNADADVHSDGGSSDACAVDAAACTQDPCSGVTCTVAGESCQAGRCVDPCAGVACPGQQCVAGTCMDPCVGVQCAANQACKGGKCVDSCVGASCACASVTCPANQKCVAGACQSNCAGVSCSLTQKCDVATGSCVPLCSGVSCEATQKCDPSSGSCIPLCTGVVCSVNQKCVSATGSCVDNCTGVTCAAGQKCLSSTGACVPNCTGVTCGANQKCDPTSGTCVGNCSGVTCGANLKCDPTAGSCVDVCTGGGVGSASHCCAATDCPQATLPVCSSHTCVAQATGQACTANTQCGTGYCVAQSGGGGSVCCQNACGGACNAGCRANDGVCVHKASRTQCGKITFTSPGEDDIFQTCDGAGNCAAPIVRCGTSTPSCDLNQAHFCCSRFADPTDSTSIQPRTCGALSTCVAWHSNSQATGETCRVSADCPTGQQCCLEGQDASLWQVCAASCQAAGVPQACDPTAVDCPAGKTCQSYGGGFYICF